MATASVFPFASFPVTATPQMPSREPRAARRRTTPQQGRALEVLSHAIEYLIDSRLPEGGPTSADNGALRLLMACSRSVFEDSVEVVPVHQRVHSWIEGRLRKRHA